MRLREWVTAAVGLAAVFVSVLVIGGALRWTQAMVAALVAIALIPTITSRRVLVRSPLIAILAVAAGLTAFQLIPLPEGILDVLNPTGMALRADGAALFDISPWQSTTLDVAGTLRALAFFAILLGIALIALRIAVTERGRYRILASVTALCGITAVVVWLHKLFGATSVYGLYKPVFAGPHLLGPLLNLNHLGCLMAAGTVLALSLSVHFRQSKWMRVVWVATIVLCGTLTVATVSRGATLALIVGVLVVGITLIAQRMTDQNRRAGRRSELLTKSLPIAVVGVCTVFIVIYSSAGNVSRELGKLSFDEISRPRTKFAEWTASAELVEESPWVGVGRGGFETSFTRVYPDAGFSTFSHTENAYLQAVVDWGIPWAALICVALGWFWVVALRRWRDGPLSAGALGALAVVAIQSNVDFGIELLAIAAPATAIAATLAYVPLREGRSRWLASGLRIGHIVGLLVAAIALLSNATSTVAEDHARIDETSTLDEIRAVAQRHPFDYYVYAQAAQQLARTGDPASVSLLNHALRLHPTHPGLHRIAARLLLRSGNVAQAAIEYAEAIRVGGSPQQLVKELVTALPPAQAIAGIPLDYPYLGQIVQLLEDLKRRDLALAWLAALQAREPGRAGVCPTLFEVALRDQNLPAIESTVRACGEVSLDPPMRLALVRLLAARGAHEDVLRLVGNVEDWTGGVEAKVAGWLALCDAQIALRRWDEAKRCVRRLDASALLSREAGIEIRSRLDQIEKGKTAPVVLP
ncbi:hypothetical protein BH11MYX3_BH11MYX3_41180 [soil metagenome]